MDNKRGCTVNSKYINNTMETKHLKSNSTQLSKNH